MITGRPPMPCSKGMRACAPTCAHRRFVREYVAERDEQLVAAEAVAHGYGTETADYFQEHDRLTFKRWLQTRAGLDYPHPRTDRNDLLEQSA